MDSVCCYFDVEEWDIFHLQQESSLNIDALGNCVRAQGIPAGHFVSDVPNSAATVSEADSLI